MEPLLRWVGGKRRASPVLRSCVSRLQDFCHRRLIEPFVGGGAFFFDHHPPDAVLSDSNSDLIAFYTNLSNQPDRMYAEIQQLAPLVGRDHYLAVREQYHSMIDGPSKAAAFYYLNRCGFNGLWRVNAKGRYNVPYGERRLIVPSLSTWSAASNILRAATLKSCDFRLVMSEVRDGDFVFLDPPYPSMNRTELFSRYTAAGFGFEDHLALQQYVKEIDARGAHFLLMLSGHEKFRAMYSDYSCCTVDNTYISGGQGVRAPVTELIVTNF